MKAVVFHAPLQIHLEEVEKPKCPPGGLLVQIEACGVCGTDLKSYRHGNFRIQAPQIIGHEFCGRIIESRADFREATVGDRMVMATSISCGHCYFCHQGWTNLCDSVAPMGFSYAGGMAEFVAIPERAIKNGHVIKVPEGILSEQAALSEPLSCAVNAAETTGIKEKDTVVIVGAGPMGLINFEVARARGAEKITIIEISSQRRRIARRFGPDLILDPTQDDLISRIKQFSQDRGADVVIVAAPSKEAHEQAFSLVRKKGVLCLFASLPAGKSTIAVDSRVIHYRELTIVATSDSTPQQVRQALRLLKSGQVRADLLVTHTLPLKDFKQAFELMENKESLRVVLKP